ncbi:MAG: hypothetical protein ACI4A5_07250 [Hominilimicola sp.]
MDEVIDLTACLAKGKVIRIEGKEYEIKFDFRAIHSLEQQYGNLGAALDSFMGNENLYDNVLNFLYAACGEKYKLKKTDIEEWISLSTIFILHDLIFEAILSSIGTKNEKSEQGEI